MHYRNLKQDITLGLKVEKTHTILKFKQSPWMKTYIDLNTDQRKLTQNDFNFFFIN